MKYFLILTSLVSIQAFAGNSGSSMHAGPHGGGCTNVHMFNCPPTSITFNITQPPAPSGIDLTQPAPAPVLPPPSQGDIKANELRQLYTNFNAITDRPTEAQVGDFVTETSRIILRFPEHNPIAKRRWSGESRLAFKILFGMICYIGNQSDSEVSGWLHSDGGLTDTQMRELDQFRSINGIHQMAAVAACMIGSGSPSHSPLTGIVSTFLNRY